MAMCALAGLGVGSGKPDDWGAVADGLPGMQKIDGGAKSLAFRMDDRAERQVVSGEPGETLAVIGFEVAERADLQDCATRLEAAGVTVHPGDAALADWRLVGALIRFEDPMGNRVELIHTPMIASDPVVRGRPIEGVKTGPLGMGHTVLHVQDIDVMMPFYRDVPGFGVSDDGLDFCHLTGRHHSFAMVGSGQRGVHHVTVEYDNLDDVGQGHDIAQTRGQVGFALGRHTDDWMSSSCALTPSGVVVKNGRGGRIIGPAARKPHETFDGPSYWGHERMYLPKDNGDRMRDMAMEVASRGLRAPPVADCPRQYGELAKGSC